jgi:hypothetical protein
MGWVIMSERELNRIEVLAQIDDGRLSVQNGANMLDIIMRQMFRLLKTYRTDGARETCWDIVPSDTTGPKPPLNPHSECCGAARHCGHSCMVQHFCWLKRRSAVRLRWVR